MAEVSDNKLAQTAINLLCERVVDPIVAADGVAATIRGAIVANDLTEFFTPAELAALQSFVADLAALANSPVVSALQARHVPTHHNRALTIEGVN
jgi:hypothetical protein